MSEVHTAAAKPEDFTATAVEPYMFLGDDQHESAMSEVLDVTMLETSNGQHFSGLHMNRAAASDNPVIVRLNSYHSSSTTRQQKYTTYQFAAAHPDHQIVAIDLPSHGRSDRPPIRQYADIVGKRALSGIAESQADALVQFLPDEHHFIILGDSLGGQLAPSMARSLAELGRDPQMVLAFDPAGMHGPVKRQGPKKGGHRSGFGGHDAYHLGAANNALDAAYAAFNAELDIYEYDDVEYDAKNLWKQDPVIAAAILIKGSSHRHAAAGLEELKMALAEIPTLEVAIVSGGLSRVCHWKSLAVQVSQLRQQYGVRFTWDLWPNDSHSLGVAEQQPRLAAFASAQVGSRIYPS